MAQNPNSTNDRIDQAMRGGTPQIDPDQQRKYLGTFRERVSLVVKIKDMSNPKAIADVKKELSKNNHYTLIMNGQLSDGLTAPYMKIANDTNTKFDLESDGNYFTKPDSYGVVYASNEAINQYPIDVFEKYSNTNKSANKSKASSKPKPKQKHGFMHFLKNLL